MVEGSQVHLVANSDQLVELTQTVGHPVPLPSRRKLLKQVHSNWGLKLSAAGIASLIWALVFMTGTSVRSFTVPIEFVNVPAGLEISEAAGDMLVQLRAATRLFTTLDESQLVARVNLRGMAQGVHTIKVVADNLNLPPGISLERTVPALRVRLVPR